MNRLIFGRLGNGEPGKTPHEVAVDRIRELRKRHGFTQQQLADRLNLIGAQTDRVAVAKVETGKRGISLTELFQYAMALDVAPVHLVSPPDSDEPIALGPNMKLTPDTMRGWVRGFRPLLWQDERIYFSEVPKNEFKAAEEALERWQQAPWYIWDPESDTEQPS